jgi:hypothetical protein
MRVYAFSKTKRLSRTALTIRRMAYRISMA